jgi:hypothetical protein
MGSSAKEQKERNTFTKILISRKMDNKQNGKLMSNLGE